MSVLNHTRPFEQKSPAWLTRLWALVGGVSVRTKILGIVLVLTTLLGLGATLQVRAVMERVFISELESRGRSVVSDLATRSTEPILLNDSFALYQLLSETVASHKDLLYAFVINGKGEVLAHTFGDEGFPSALLTLNAPKTPEESGHLLYESNEGRVHDLASPIFDGRAGVVRLGLSESRLNGAVDSVTGQMLFTTLVVGLIGIFAAILLTWLLTQPILELVHTTHRIGQGDLSVRATHWADDEVGALADAFNQMIIDLDNSQQAIAEKEIARGRLLKKLINAQEEERKRIARELHDGVGQSLTSLTVGMKVACQLDDQQAMQAKAEDMRQRAMETLQQVRLLSRQLRPSVLDDLGLNAALELYVTEFSKQYPDISVDLLCEQARPSPVIETALYRIVQEAMTNAARHSGAKTISAVLSRRDDKYLAIIEDDGHGFDVTVARRSGRSVGIYGMAERAEFLGGRLDIESSFKGTTVYLEVPL